MKIKFSKTEIQHVFISILLLGFCFSFKWSGEFSTNSWLNAFISSLVIVSIILFTKLAVQKYVANRFECDITYSSWTGGLALALLTTVGTLGTIIWAAPGAVSFKIKHKFRLGKSKNNVHPGPREFAIIAASGILVYFIFAFIGKLFFVENSIFFEKLLFIGSYLAIFNLIPFVHSPFKTKKQLIPRLDGVWIFFGSRSLWAISFAFVVLSVIGFIFLDAWISVLIAIVFAVLFFLLWEYKIEPWTYSSPTQGWIYKK